MTRFFLIMDSRNSSSSSESFVSIDVDFVIQKVEMVVTNNDETNRSDASAGNNLNSDDQRADSSDKDLKLLDIKFTDKWVRLTIAMSFTALSAVLSISFITNKGKLQPETLFRQKPFSFIWFLTVLMVAFFFAINGVIFSQKFPRISRVFSVVALTSVILSFTVLLWALLPPGFSWAPWIFFTFTFGSLLYVCGLRLRQRNLKVPDN